MGYRIQRGHSLRAFTFVEVLVAVTLMVIGFLGVYASLGASALLRETSNETNIAMFHLQATMEYIFGLPFDNITTTLPAGNAVNIMTIVDANVGNNFQLNNEKITVAYDNPAANPLNFTITVKWVSRMGTKRSESLSCGRTR